MTPKVSVIMPCYNEPEDVFRRSIESVIEQTLEDFEIIIILDNPENDELRTIIREYKGDCEKILFLDPGKNLGKGPARNLAIERAKGEYIAIHDSDDVDVPERLEEQLNTMEENPDVSFTIARIRHVDAKGNETENQPRYGDKNSPSVFKMPFNHPTFFAKKSVIQAYEGYKDLPYGQDYELFMRLILGGEKILYSDKTYSDYLSPVESTHNDYFEKMRKTYGRSIQRTWSYRNHPGIPRFFLYERLLKELVYYGVLCTIPSQYERSQKVFGFVMKQLRKVKYGISKVSHN